MKFNQYEGLTDALQFRSRALGMKANIRRLNRFPMISMLPKVLLWNNPILSK